MLKTVEKGLAAIFPLLDTLVRREVEQSITYEIRRNTLLLKVSTLYKCFLRVALVTHLKTLESSNLLDLIPKFNQKLDGLQHFESSFDLTTFCSFKYLFIFII